MGYGTFESTHNNILESGRRLFLENGYERTNIRAICKDAGITHGSFYRHFDSKEALFGALVQPALDSFNALYDRSSDECLDMVETSQFEKTWNISEETSKDVVRLIYEHFNSFKLLLECADGTQYSNFLNELVEMEIRGTQETVKLMQERGTFIRALSEDKLHMLTHAYLSCIFEVVQHNFTLEEALENVQCVVEFFSAGWKKVLGL